MTSVDLFPPADQRDLQDVAHVLDTVFGVTAPSAILRVGFMFDLLRSDQFVLLAREDGRPVGAAVGLRARAHVELTHMAVVRERQGRGIGRDMFARLCDWTMGQSYSCIQWSVAPGNVSGVAAYLSWDARMTGWVDNAYGVDGDAYNRGESHRFRGQWQRDGWPTAIGHTEIPHGDLAALRQHITGGQAVVGTTQTTYLLSEARPQSQ